MSTLCFIDSYSLSPCENRISFYTANGSSVFPTDTTTMSFTHISDGLPEFQLVAKAVAQLPHTWHASLFLHCLPLIACRWLILSRETSLQSTLFAWRENNVDMIRGKAIGTEAAKKAPHARTHMHFVVVQTLLFSWRMSRVFQQNIKIILLQAKNRQSNNENWQVGMAKGNTLHVFMRTFLYLIFQTGRA